MENVKIENSLMVKEAIKKEIDSETHKLGLAMDSNKLKRILSNRFSARRSRMRKIQYKYDMEQQMKHLQEMVWTLSPMIEQEKQGKEKLEKDNQQCRLNLQCLTQLSDLRTAEIKSRQVEVKKMREALWRAQRMKEEPIMSTDNTIDSWDDEFEQIMCIINSNQSPPPTMLD